MNSLSNENSVNYTRSSTYTRTLKNNSRSVIRALINISKITINSKNSTKAPVRKCNPLFYNRPDNILLELPLLVSRA